MRHTPMQGLGMYEYAFGSGGKFMDAMCAARMSNVKSSVIVGVANQRAAHHALPAREATDRPSRPEMNSAAAISRSRSTPVSMPKPRSK